MKKGYLTNKEYNYIYSKSPRLCIDIVIGKGNDFLLLKRATSPYKGKYSLPGGRVRFRESIDSAIHRIAKKEIGVDVSVIKMLGFMEFTKETQGKNKRHSISIAFLCDPKTPIKFINPPEKNIHPVHLKFLKGL